MMIKKTKEHVHKAAKASLLSLNTAIDQAPPELRKIAKRVLLTALILIVTLTGYKWLNVHFEERARASELAAGPMVKISKVVQSPGEHTITLIGETRPYQEATLYAKVSGYLKSVKVDKGDMVKAGQILAVIESPETDQGFEAAFADNKNKQAIASRMNKLFDKHLVSEQEVDQSRADAEVAAARKHTEEILKSYETLKAPFDGMITSRFADPGALVQNATNSQSSALPVVTISTVNRLRVDVFVDQHDASYVEKDQAIEITMSERPGVKIEGKVSRVSGELDPRTKMLLTEIDLPNDKQELVAGSFVQVALRIKAPPYLLAPVEALMVRDNKSYLTVVTPQNQITLKEVQIANNDGKLLSIISGVDVGETVAMNVTDTVPEGGKVRPIVEAAAIPATTAPASVGKAP